MKTGKQALHAEGVSSLPHPSQPLPHSLLQGARAKSSCEEAPPPGWCSQVPPPPLPPWPRPKGLFTSAQMRALSKPGTSEPTANIPRAEAGAPGRAQAPRPSALKTQALSHIQLAAQVVPGWGLGEWDGGRTPRQPASPLRPRFFPTG